MDKSNRKICCKPVVFILLLPVLLTLLSCSSSLPKTLTDSQKLWETNKIANYDFTLERQCFCPEDVRGPVNIQVRDSKPVSVSYVSNGNPVTQLFGDIDTIDELFQQLRDAYQGKSTFGQKAERVDVTYDSTYGYPSDIFIDVSTLIADEEQGWTVTNFKIVQ